MMKKRRGFTLIEVLVVVSILGVLMGLISILVLKAGSDKEKMLTKTLVANLSAAIDNFKMEFKRLPPMTMTELPTYPKWKDLSITGNTTNECNECLAVALGHPDFSKRTFEWTFGNTDGDIWNMVPEGSDVVDAREILDAYRNPVVYISKTWYGQPVKIVRADGTEVEVNAVKKPSGVYYNQDSYQLISLGKNGVQDTDPDVRDDIENFTRVEE